ncbi:ThiF family adenylyltransferase [Salibacterium halotolerans]|uniref:Adenylyltransferase and sulfurtransferase n=1 Tax=Salibacterium halotolerans TaxID=1884432 RepID=A0A1I5LKA1_9BACI|nr:ThiF family adenylyltransferase [Salibacterium halotolerans]SFO97804.1 adenylyltransferase and sulfurtransferase [Salibacterium halotolerans]
MEHRYSRQEQFAPINKEGQKRLLSSHVLIMGCGALGSACAEMLVRAGVGALTLIDRDVVEPSNLHRQNLYAERDAGGTVPKAEAAKERLQKINSFTSIHAYVLDAGPEQIDKLAPQCDVMIDGSDNFDIRFILNDAAEKHGVPWAFGAAAGSVGMSCLFLPGRTPCLHCLMQGMPDGTMTCDASGIISPAVQMTASLQTAEVMKLVTGNTEALHKKLVLFDIWNGTHQPFGFSSMKQQNCPSCGTAPEFPYLRKKNRSRIRTLCGSNTVHIHPGADVHYNFPLLEQHLAQHGEVKKNKHLLTCMLPSLRLAVFTDGRILIHGTNNPEEAEAVYHHYVEKAAYTVEKEPET